MNQMDLEPQPEQVYRIPLSRGQFATVDKEDFESLSRWKWYAWWSKNRKNFYAARGYEGSIVWMHRQILQPPKGAKTDHQDGDTLNNRRYNLRVATSPQNAWNQGKNRCNTSGFKGVSWCSRRNRWLAQIKHKGDRRYIGLFRTKEEAHAAFVAIAKELRGDFFHE